jgi:UDP-3-O-[3-hydroxymyristoyl] N-acetylglucosamine deacetylase
MKTTQRTLAKDVSASGIGLHSGKLVRMRLSPAAVDTGIVFRRTDNPDAQDMKVCPEAVTDTRLCTQVGEVATGVGTVEHLLSALFGLGIDNVVVEIDAPEIPIFDGSSAPFLYLIQSAGIVAQDAPKKAIKVLRPVEIKDGNRLARFTPDDHFSVTLEIDFNHPVIPRQRKQFDVIGDLYGKDIARARTFCFQKDVEKMQSMGLALGGGLDNAIVISEFSILNPGDLRYPDEFLRHKVLDCIGDLYMAGHMIIGAFEGVLTGHGMNNKLLRALMADPKNYSIVELPDDAEVLPFTAVA